MEILKVQNLCKTYGKGDNQVQALKDVSFTIEKGTFCAIVGESGSGKSTLLNCIGALDTPTSGAIYLDGQDLFSMKEQKRTVFRRQNIGFVFQSFQLITELTVEQNLIFPLLLDYQKPDPHKVDEILEVLGLTDRRRAPAWTAVGRPAAARSHWTRSNHQTYPHSGGRTNWEPGF